MSFEMKRKMKMVKYSEEEETGEYTESEGNVLAEYMKMTLIVKEEYEGSMIYGEENEDIDMMW